MAVGKTAAIFFYACIRFDTETRQAENPRINENEPKKPSWIEWPFKWIDGYGESTRRIIQNVISWAIVGALGLTIGYFWNNHEWLTQGSKSAWNLLKYPVTVQVWVGALVAVAVNWFSVLIYRKNWKAFEATKQSVKLLSDEHKKKLDELAAGTPTNDSTERQRRILLTSIVDLVNSPNKAYDTLGGLVLHSDTMTSENDVKWLCQELVKHNYKHPFEVFEMASDNALDGKWLKLLREARLANPPVKNDMGMLSFLAMRWSEKEAWLAAKRKHEEKVQAASMAYVFGDKVGHRCSSCGNMVLINTDTESYKCGCGHEEVVKPKSALNKLTEHEREIVKKIGGDLATLRHEIELLAASNSLDKKKHVQTLLLDFQAYFRQHKLALPKELAKEIEEFLDMLVRSGFSVNMLSSMEIRNDLQKAEAIKQIDVLFKDVPARFQSLEDSFRKLLGST